MMHPPPSQGRIRNPLGNISALTKDGIGSCDPASERSHICMPKSIRIKIWTIMLANMSGRVQLQRFWKTPEFDKFGSQNNLPQDSHPPKWWCISVYKNPEEEPKLLEHTSARSPAHTYYFSKQVQLSSNTRRIYPQEEVTHRGNRRGRFHQKKQNTNQGVNASRSVYFFLTCVYKSSIVPPFPVEIAHSV
jgi:hypothetical protein